jgi:hypothetical protein
MLLGCDHKLTPAQFFLDASHIFILGFFLRETPFCYLRRGCPPGTHGAIQDIASGNEHQRRDNIYQPD